jgi:hypothetical protein
LECEAEDEKLTALALIELTPNQLAYWKGSEHIVMKASNDCCSLSEVDGNAKQDEIR